MSSAGEGASSRSWLGRPGLPGRAEDGDRAVRADDAARGAAGAGVVGEDREPVAARVEGGRHRDALLWAGRHTQLAALAQFRGDPDGPLGHLHLGWYCGRSKKSTGAAVVPPEWRGIREMVVERPLTDDALRHGAPQTPLG